jgi:hypothetical protein
MVKITGYIWHEDIVDKLIWKHQVGVEEVNEVFKTARASRDLKEGIDPAKIYTGLWDKQMRALPDSDLHPEKKLVVRSL